MTDIGYMLLPKKKLIRVHGYLPTYIYMLMYFNVNYFRTHRIPISMETHLVNR